jgi:hypothetical protein
VHILIKHVIKLCYGPPPCKSLAWWWCCSRVGVVEQPKVAQPGSTTMVGALALGVWLGKLGACKPMAWVGCGQKTRSIGHQTMLAQPKVDLCKVVVHPCLPNTSPLASINIGEGERGEVAYTPSHLYLYWGWPPWLGMALTKSWHVGAQP